MKKIIVVLLCIVAGVANAGEESCRRIRAHLLIGDARNACREARHAISGDPYDSDLAASAIRAFAAAGEEKEMLECWQKYTRLVDTPYKHRDIIESMAWAPIDRAAKAQSPIPRYISLVAALYSHDSKGIDIIQRQLRDNNRLLRAMAVRVSAELQDKCLRDEVYRLFREERAGIVKLEAATALGKMGVKKAEQELLQLIGDRHVDAETRAAAIASLLQMKGRVNAGELTAFAKSNRAGLRQLAARVVAAFQLDDLFSVIEPLLDDGHAQVRIAAIHAMGIVHPEEVDGKPAADVLRRLTEDPNGDVAIYAARTLMFYDREEGQQHLKKWFNDPILERRRLAAALLSGGGANSMPLMEKIFRKADDPYIKMNLALGLIGQRHCTDDACEALYTVLNSNEERWVWNEQPGYRAVLPAKTLREQAVPGMAEAQSELTRLEILSVLAMLNHPKAQDAAKAFLEKRTWGISGSAAALLLTEGDDTAVDLIEGLLNDPDPKISIQAALILALWGRSEKAITILEDAYDHSDRDTQIRILEGLGRIGHERSLPFLIDKLGSPQQSLRVIAAAALLQTLNH
ncbi:MAG: HEAT repeat domain-containing protein [Chlamydiales bacterium]|nr:HEAT repeat domain-containing protein [Chlamydiia bacterium]MCP5506760.1 HEAT repeat domain-containing protein [Chlamydiales bacterium]